MLHGLLGYVLPACRAGLEDPDDDVRAVAADALIPTAAAIVALDGQTLHSIVMLLWDILLDLDDLSPSTSRYTCWNRFDSFFLLFSIFLRGMWKGQIEGEWCPILEIC